MYPLSIPFFQVKLELSLTLHCQMLSHSQQMQGKAAFDILYIFLSTDSQYECDES